MKIVRLGGRCGQFGFHGQAILFAQRVEEIVEQLPLSLDSVGLVIVSEIKEIKNVQRIKDYSVSLEKLSNALHWLVKHNHLYSSVKIQMPESIDVNSLVIQPNVEYPKTDKAIEHDTSNLCFKF